MCDNSKTYGTGMDAGMVTGVDKADPAMKDKLVGWREELKAMETIYKSLEPLTHQGQIRALRAACILLGYEDPVPTHGDTLTTARRLR